MYSKKSSNFKSRKSAKICFRKVCGIIKTFEIYLIRFLNTFIINFSLQLHSNFKMFACYVM